MNWYLALRHDVKTISEACTHRGHIKSNSYDISCSISSLSEEAIKTIMSLHHCQHNPSTIAATITDLYGNNENIYTSKQIAHIIAKKSTELVCENYNDLSSAEQLLYKFDTISKEAAFRLQYVALVHSMDDGYKIRLPHGRPSKVANDIEDYSINQIRESMRISDSQEVLLAIAWCTEYEISMIQKFPELITFDVTEKTNNQKRGLFVGTGLDGNGQIFPCIHVFMPNSQISSYGWIYNHAIPSIWGKETISNIQAIGTDGEYAMYSPLQNLVNMRGDWGGAHIYR